MYSSIHNDLFPEGKREFCVYVAISNDPVFDRRWKEVIQPAIQQTSVEGRSLYAKRIEAESEGDSILVEYENGISNSLLVFVDISSTAVLDRRPVRDATVMYQLGVAHSKRRPEDVLVFRSDNEMMLFDTANSRAVSYDPLGNPKGAIKALRLAFESALGEQDNLRRKTVSGIAKSLDGVDFSNLAHCSGPKGFEPPPRTYDIRKTAYNSVSWDSLRRLLEIGLVYCDHSAADFSKLEGDALSEFDSLFPYKLTSLGNAVFMSMAETMQDQLRDMATRFGVIQEEGGTT